MNRKDLVCMVTSVLSSLGFINRKTSWYRLTDELVLVWNLQKSDYGGQFYMNLGLSLRGLNSDEYPAEEKCHIRIRLDKICPDGEVLLRALDLENTKYTDEEKKQIINTSIKHGSTWLCRLNSSKAIGEEIAANKLLGNRTTVQAKQFIESKK
jgi:hypothetical protein